MLWNRRTAAGLLAAATLAAAGCRDEPAQPVARVAAEPAALTLAYPQSAELTLTWSPQAAIEASGGRPIVFVHLLADDGEVVRTFDHPFPRDWEPGSEASYPLTLYQSMLGPPVPAGSYRLTLGLYDGDTRWPLDGCEEIGRMEYQVARVEVPRAQPATLPEVDYAGSWRELAAGGDRQVLGYRWLGDRGEVRVQGAGRGGELGMAFELADPPAGRQRVLEGDAEVPCLRLTSTCDDSERTLSGSGRVTLSVAVPAGRDCSVQLAPNYRFSEPTGAAAATATEEEPPLARLIVVTWDPAAG